MKLVMAHARHRLGNYSIQQNKLNVKRYNGIWNVDELMDIGHQLNEYY